MNPLELLIVRKPYEFDRDLIVHFLSQLPSEHPGAELDLYLDDAAEGWRQLVFDGDSQLIMVLWWHPQGEGGWRWVFVDKNCPETEKVFEDLFELWQRQLTPRQMSQLKVRVG